MEREGRGWRPTPAVLGITQNLRRKHANALDKVTERLWPKQDGVGRTGSRRCLSAMKIPLSDSASEVHERVDDLVEVVVVRCEGSCMKFRLVAVQDESP